MSLGFEEPTESKPELDIVKKMRDYEREFRELIADEVWKYLDRAGINVDKVTEREIDEAVESYAAELAEILARKVQNASKIVSAIERFGKNLERVKTEVSAIASKIEKVAEYTDGTMRNDMKEVAEGLKEALSRLERSVGKIGEMMKKVDDYVKEIENEMERMASEAASEILERFGLK